MEILAGYYVLCAATGAEILLSELKYWCVATQKAYSGPEVVDTASFYTKSRVDT